MKRILTLFIAVLCVSVMLVPMASAQRQRRQDMKNQWRNIAIGSGGAAILGLLTKHSELTLAGAAGAAYSAYRYEQERKHQSQNRYGNYGNNRYNQRGYNDRGYNDQNAYSGGGNNCDNGGRHDNGRHRGWSKHGHHGDDD